MAQDEGGENQGDAGSDRPLPAKDGQDQAPVNQKQGDSGHHGSAAASPGLTRFERISVAVQLVTVAILIVYTVASFLMWRAMEKSNAAASAALIQGRDQFNQLRSDATKGSNKEQERFLVSLAESARQADAGRSQSSADARASLELARKSLGESRRALEISRRAHLAVFAWKPFSLAGGFQEMSVDLRNVGSVPATNVDVVAFAEVRPGPLPDNWIMPPEATNGREAFRAVIAPGQDDWIGNRDCLLSPQDAQSVASGRQQLYYVGRVTYDDGFGRIRHLGYCAHHHASGDGWDICPNNNYAD